VLILASGVFFSVCVLGIVTHFWATIPERQKGFLGGCISVIAVIVYFVSSAFYQSTLLPNLTIALIPLGAAIIVTLVYLKIRRGNNIEEKICCNNYPEKRTILLYSLPWVLFSLIDVTLARYIDSGSATIISSNLEIIILAQMAFSFLGAFLGGIIADFFGRKLSIILSITLYGLSMAFFGLTQSFFFLIFSISIEGLSWGILLTMYMFVIWGDLASKENYAKMYAMGLAIFYFAIGIGELLQTFQISISSIDSALIACSVIFMSNLPIALAPELLSKRSKDAQNLRDYVKRIRKLKIS
jgi:hypothetical protein